MPPESDPNFSFLLRNTVLGKPCLSAHGGASPKNFRRMRKSRITPGDAESLFQETKPGALSSPGNATTQSGQYTALLPQPTHRPPFLGHSHTVFTPGLLVPPGSELRKKKISHI